MTHEFGRELEREAENERLRQEVQDLTDELAYHGVYPK